MLYFIGNAPATATGSATAVNTNAFWIGLNSLGTTGAPPTWVGDGTSTFTDWFTGEPLPATLGCGVYNQVTTVDNIHMDAFACTGAAPAPAALRFICEVSDDCMALFMSRYPTSYFHHPNNNHGHVHYNAGGILPIP
jgi:hypothetical protein